ncbi:hypothetical protein D9M68_951110 [compost metagenome]
MRKALPLNSNLAMAQEAARPKTTLSGTAMAATSSVRRMAAWASFSIRAAKKVLMPLAKASWNTA